MAHAARRGVRIAADEAQPDRDQKDRDHVDGQAVLGVNRGEEDGGGDDPKARLQRSAEQHLLADPRHQRQRDDPVPVVEPSEEVLVRPCHLLGQTRGEALAEVLRGRSHPVEQPRGRQRKDEVPGLWSDQTEAGGGGEEVATKVDPDPNGGEDQEGGFLPDEIGHGEGRQLQVGREHV